MVSLTMMARLLEAVRPDARLLLVGDPDQLTSVDAGAVLADLVARPTRRGPTRCCRARRRRPDGAGRPGEAARSPASTTGCATASCG
jgi:exodeoxyribonuclease V alpha subunit